ncbi:MAG: hypothetical protein K5906_02505 [Bacilli bacterium]|nr:hypothetical protein [Bacilli bacterium]
MKKASSIFYLITGIFASAAAILLIIIAILSFAGVYKVAGNGEEVNMVAYGITLLIFALIELVAAAIGFHGHKLSKEGSPKKGFHIFCIVLGAITMDPFLLLASIFGLVGASQN